MIRCASRSVVLALLLALLLAPLAQAGDGTAPAPAPAPGLQGLEATEQRSSNEDPPADGSEPAVQRVVWPWVAGAAAAGALVGFLLAVMLRPEPPPPGTLGVIELGGE